MVCARCGTAFEGRFCPKCAPPVAARARGPPQSAPPSVRCSRCGSVYAGGFCPACGLAAWGLWMHAPVRGPSVGYGLLNVAWFFSLIAILVILAISTVGIFAALVPIGNGIKAIDQGATSDPGFDSPGSWSFIPESVVGASGTVNTTGGNPGPYGEMRLDGRPGSIIAGFWNQSFVARGSSPYLAAVRLDYRVFQLSDILQNLTLAVYVDKVPGPRSLFSGGDAWRVTLTQTTSWTHAQTVYRDTGEVLDAIEVSSYVPRAGTYYLKVAAIAWNRAGSPGTPTIVGFDNVRLTWRTAAFVDVAIYAPVPILFYLSQDPVVFYVWTAGVVAATVAALGFLVLTDRKTLWETIRLGPEKTPAKLRSRSATVAIMQTFLAVTFLSLIVAILTQPPEPSFFSEIPQWYFLFSLLNAPVYEELVFRVLIIGVPMMLGSLYLRATGIARGRLPTGSTRGRYVAGALRYLVGGGMSRRTPLPVLLPAALFLVASSVGFGLPHAPGYGIWKVLPTTVAGLAMGYLFLRHGLHAAILFPFAVDGFVATAYVVGVDSPLGIAMYLALLVLGLSLGAGFFAYYVLYVFRLVQDVVRPRERASAAPGIGGAVPGGMSATPGTPPSMASNAPPMAPPATAPYLGVPPGYLPATRPPVYGTSP